MTDANRARLSGMVEGFERFPLLHTQRSAAIATPRRGIVHQHQVNVVKPELLQAQVERRGGGGFVQAAGNLRRDEKRVARATRRLNRFANANLVEVPKRGVDVRVAAPACGGGEGWW